MYITNKENKKKSMFINDFVIIIMFYLAPAILNKKKINLVIISS